MLALLLMSLTMMAHTEEDNDQRDQVFSPQTVLETLWLS